MLSDLDLLSDDPEIVAVTPAEDWAPEPDPVALAPGPEAAPEAPLPPRTPEIQPEAPPSPAPAAPDGPGAILASQILVDRPDVLNAYFVEHIRHAKGHADWVRQIGGSDSAEGYARYWYERNGRFEGYNQGQITAGDNIDIGRLLAERPDVFHAYQRDYFDHKGWKSHAWKELVGGTSAEDYAKYWFRNHGEHEGYNQRPPAPAAAEVIEPPADAAPPADSAPQETLVVGETAPADPVAVAPAPAPPCEEPEEEAAPAPPPAPPAAVQPDPEEPPAQDEVIVIVGAAADDPILV